MKRLAIGSTLMLALATGAAAQSPAPTEPAPVSVFRSGASLVALNVTVTDGKRLVPGLTPGRLRGVRGRRPPASPVLRGHAGSD